ncbi:hypothetical protein [Rufibacter tibetensis]|uniref:hypothetical protein n=1 Tax=Rufibacter tibetensis TaxID=512763 RepID=UPI001470243D|nr:hypothetical protein [Rufibacter tibetensis]
MMMVSNSQTLNNVTALNAEFFCKAATINAIPNFANGMLPIGNRFVVGLSVFVLVQRQRCRLWYHHLAEEQQQKSGDIRL